MPAKKACWRVPRAPFRAPKAVWIDIWAYLALETARPGRRSRLRDKSIFPFLGPPEWYRVARMIAPKTAFQNIRNVP